MYGLVGQNMLKWGMRCSQILLRWTLQCKEIKIIVFHKFNVHIFWSFCKCAQWTLLDYWSSSKCGKWTLIDCWSFCKCAKWTLMDSWRFYKCEIEHWWTIEVFANVKMDIDGLLKFLQMWKWTLMENIGNNLKTSKKWKTQGSWNGTIVLTNEKITKVV
jgi:hypothetical protein